jgi:hypothetical protein
MDLFVIPTIGFDLLHAFVVVRLDRRDLIWINVTANPTAEWVARQITEAFPWDEAPYYPHPRSRPDLWQCRHAPIARHRHPGQANRTSLALAEWRAERLIGSIRRECVDHIIVLGETHLRRVLKSYARTHRSLKKDAPVSPRFSEPVRSGRAPSWADFITTTAELKFSVRTAGSVCAARRNFPPVLPLKIPRRQRFNAVASALIP